MTATANTPSVLPLVLDGVSFEAGGRRLLDRISTTFLPGVRTVILGPNGAGKSLLLRLCHGLIKPTAGKLRWSETLPRRVQRAQAMVFQRPVLLRRSVVANIDFALRVRGVAHRERARRSAHVLAGTGLSEHAGRPARVLSSGEQQRLALARAWALEPEVLFLDEPTANLDPAATRSVEEIIAAIHHSGTKVVMTTHDLGQAHRQADEVMFLHKGQRLEQTPAAEFFDHPRSEQARAFLAGELLS